MQSENESLLSLDTINASRSTDSVGAYGSSPATSPNNNSKEEDVSPRRDHHSGDGAAVINPGEADSPAENNNSNEGQEEEDDDVPDVPLEHHIRTDQLYRSAVFATFPVFSAYASMIALQAGLKKKIGITDADKERSDIFGAGVALLYAMNAVMRLAHNIVFGPFLTPRQRAMLSYVLVCIANLTLVLAYWVAEDKHLVWVFIAYFLSGVAIGNFESNIMATLSPLGHGTKSWAVLGLPSGFQLIAVGSFIAFSIDDNTWAHGAIYFVVAAMNIAGLFFFTFYIPKPPESYASGNDNVAKFKEDLKLWREWLPRIKFQVGSLFLDMFSVSMFSSISYYMYDDDNLPLWPRSEKTVNNNIWLIIYNLCGFIGDTTGRKLLYAFPSVRNKNPLLFLIISLIGAALVLSKTALLAPLGFGLVMLCNGLCYASGTRHTDACIDDRYILVALSAWLFVGDIGSVLASLIVQPLQIAIGNVPNATGYVPPNATNMTNLALFF